MIGSIDTMETLINSHVLGGISPTETGGDDTMETKTTSYWTKTGRGKSKRWVKAGASRFELDLSIVEMTAYPMKNQDPTEWFDGFAVCFRGQALFHGLLQGSRVECFVIARHADRTQTGTFAVIQDDDTMHHDHVLSYTPELLKSPRSHPFLFVSLEDAKAFVDSLHSITVSNTSRRDA